ncbi:MAG: Na+/H+ antiporter NhaC family protein [Pseudomonadota bacterium]
MLAKFKPGFVVFFACVTLGIYAHFALTPTWVEKKTSLTVTEHIDGRLTYREGNKETELTGVVSYLESPLRQEALDAAQGEPPVEQQWVVERSDQGPAIYSVIRAESHFGLWSLLPAFTAICLCLITKEPLTALLGGVVAGAFMLGRFDLTGDVLIPSFATDSAAGILLLYLWLLGGLLGVWSRTGAARAFATHTAKRLVRGPRSAKLATWMLGVAVFQGGTVSIALTGVAAKPLADANGVSHEETSYIVDVMGAPLASLLAFNAWPLFVQSLIFIPGVAFLSTEVDRVGFYFSSLAFSFYTIFAILGAFLVSLDYMKFAGSGLQQARQRALATGQLDAPDSNPMSAEELQETRVPSGYEPRVYEFVLPLGLLIGVAVGSYAILGSPNVYWAFGIAFVFSAGIALLKGMSLADLVDGIGDGLKGVVLASVILLLAVTVGGISTETGGGIYLIELLGEQIPYYILPVCLLLVTIAASFSTGSSWGTYAIILPLAMPLAWAVSQTQGIATPELYLSICFSCVLNGGVFGDQCSPISDTTILAATTTGCDLMDHVKTQIVPAGYALSAAAVLWTLAAFAVA